MMQKYLPMHSEKNIIGGDILITAPYYDECGNEGLEIKEFIKNSRI